MATVAEQYDQATEKLSEISRNLAFVGIATVWLFSGATADAAELVFPALLLWAAGLFVGSLTLDALHAVANVLALWFKGVRHPDGKNQGWDDEARFPDRVVIASEVLTVLKGVLVGGGFVFLLLHLVGRMP